MLPIKLSLDWTQRSCSADDVLYLEIFALKFSRNPVDEPVARLSVEEFLNRQKSCVKIVITTPSIFSLLNLL